MSNLKLCNWSFLASVLWYLHCRGLYFLYYKKSPLKRFLRKGFASDAFFTLTRPRLCAKTSITLLKIFIKLCKNFLSFVNWYISCQQNFLDELLIRKSTCMKDGIHFYDELLSVWLYCICWSDLKHKGFWSWGEHQTD